MDALVQVSGVVKRFGSVTALDGLDLMVERGEVHGFLGPNGAGKTTTLRILVGLMRADAGSLRVLGCDPWRVPRGLDRIPGVHDAVVTNHRVSAQVDPHGLMPLLQSLTEAGLRTLTSQPPSLEELFLRHYGVTADGAAAPQVGDAGRPGHD